MATLGDIRQRFKSISLKVEAYIAVKDTTDRIIELQREQMFSGLDGSGQRITNQITGSDQYSRKTIEIKRKKGQPTDRITLKDEGNFYSRFKTEVTPDVFKTTSTDKKNADLAEVYDPFGLTQESKREYITNLRPVFLKNVRQKLRL